VSDFEGGPAAPAFDPWRCPECGGRIGWTVDCAHCERDRANDAAQCERKAGSREWTA
jgi:hypothetical protein